MSAARTAGEHRLLVDWPACQAHGLCAEVLPELVAVDEWGYPVLAPGAVPDALLGLARRAAVACPTLALRLMPSPDQQSRTRTGAASR